MKRLFFALLLALVCAPAFGQSALPQSVQQFFALTPPTYVNARSLAANTAESTTVPVTAKWALFSGTADFYVCYTGAATVPGDTTDGSACERNPTMRQVNGGSAISIISASAAVVTIAYWQ